MTRTLFLTTAVLLATTVTLSAEPVSHGDLVIDGAWARESPGMARAGASYMTIGNSGEAADRLIAASSDVAARVELHTHLMQDGVMKMREVEGGVEIPAGGETVFEPGSFHVMYMGLNEPFRKGERFPVRLTFEQAGTVEIEVEVMDMQAGGMGHGGMTMQHGKGN